MNRAREWLLTIRWTLAGLIAPDLLTYVQDLLTYVRELQDELLALKHERKD